MPKRLNPNLTYNLTITSVRNNTKSWQTSAGVAYKHVINFIDKNGEAYSAEYITNAAHQDVFVEGLSQIFKVSEAQPLGDTIVPLLESDQKQEKKIITEKMKPVAGESYDKALGYAVQLHMNACPSMAIESTDIETILRYADAFDEWMIQKQTKREVGD